MKLQFWNPSRARQPTMILADAFGGVAAAGARRQNIAPIGPIFPTSKISSRTSISSCEQVHFATRLHNTYRIQNVFPWYTSWRSRRRFRRWKGRIHPPWRCVALVQRLQELQLIQEQDAVVSEAPLHSAHLIRSSVRCAMVYSLTSLLIVRRDGQVRARCRERDVLRIHQHQDPLLQRARLPREQGTYHSMIFWSRN